MEGLGSWVLVLFFFSFHVLTGPGWACISYCIESFIAMFGALKY